MRELLQQSMRFALVGVVNTAAGLAAIFGLMFFFSTGLAVANAIGYSIGFAVSFAINRSWTFRSRGPSSDLLPKYLLVVGVSYILNLSGVFAATSCFSANPYLAQVLGVGIYTVCSFLGCRWFVFAPRQFAQSPLMQFRGLAIRSQGSRRGRSGELATVARKRVQ